MTEKSRMFEFLAGFNLLYDRLAIIMITLICFIGLSVITFAKKYMKGDIKYKYFFVYLTVLILSVIITAASDNIITLLISSLTSNFILVLLMIHKSNWRAAKASGILAAKNFLVSIISMGLAFLIFYLITDEIRVSKLIDHNSESRWIPIALLLLTTAAMAQSAIWPFHKWLLSSLNSPTPVSAIMHAGLINGGGFLLVRFAPLYARYPHILLAIYVMGMISAMIGSLWKLMQSDVKRMLACSTMGQMGFMFVQCGLGLFPLAIAHLFWHGMFKAYLFLASGGAAQEKNIDFAYYPTTLTIIISIICGIFSSIVFGNITHKSWLSGDSSIFLLVIMLLTSSQMALTILSRLNILSFILAIIAVLTSAIVYGASTKFVCQILDTSVLSNPLPINALHIFGIIVLALAWFLVLVIRIARNNIKQYASWMLNLYVKALNSSQPHQDTITSHRNHYQYQ